MRGAYDACAHKVRALALQGAPLGGANVRSPVRCAFVRCNTHEGLAASQNQLSSRANPWVVVSHLVAGAGLVRASQYSVFPHPIR